MSEQGWKTPSCLKKRRISHAFTLVELLVVIAVIGLLAALLLNALSRAIMAARSTACLNNLKQLQTSFQHYTDDNEFFPSNNLVTIAAFGTLMGATWAPADLNADGIIERPEYGSLYRYHGSLNTYRCPSDRTMDKRGRPPLLVRAHSYNLSIWLNCISEPNGYVSEREINGSRKPTSDIFTFIDTHEDSIVDVAFGVYHRDDISRQSMWPDLPSDRHMQGANASFLDGHVEHRRWSARKVFVKNAQHVLKGGDRDDLRWLQDKLPPRMRRSFLNDLRPD